MKRSLRVPVLFLRSVAVFLFFTTSAISQIRQIDRTKLPQNAPVQNAYTNLLPIDQFARTPETKTVAGGLLARTYLGLLTIERFFLLATSKSLSGWTTPF